MTFEINFLGKLFGTICAFKFWFYAAFVFQMFPNASFSLIYPAAVIRARKRFNSITWKKEKKRFTLLITNFHI